jgi:acetylornithine/succinyldiaminopimelate/putrescine aminotransferase
MIALQFESFEQNKKVIDGLLEEGVFTDWFLFASECLRIVPPLIITDDEIRISSEAIKKVVSYLQ